MKILMFLTDYASYKTYLDLKNYLHNNNFTDIELDYYYFNYTFANPYKHNNQKYLFYPDNHLTHYIEHEYTDKDGGFIIQNTMFMESFMSVLKNFINGKDDLIDIDNNHIFMNTVEWFNMFNPSMNKEVFTDELSKIPRADLYLISSRLGFRNFATLTVETTLALYLIRKYGSKVFIGGGAVNDYDNIIPNLINAAGREYTHGKLEYLVGTIGINIFNYLKGYEYQNKRSPIERNVLPLDFTKDELTNYFDNSFAIELIRGCTQCCPYCCNSVINNYDTIDISNYDSWFAYFNNYSPSAHLYFYAPEINTNKEYFDRVLDYLITNNIRNPLSFYINIIKITNEQIEKLKQLNIFELSCGLDLLFDSVSYKHYELNEITEKLNGIIEICNNKNTMFHAYLVANVPKYKKIEYNMYNNIFIKYLNIITYSEYVLMLATNIAKNPQCYGLSYIYYNNRYRELNATSKIINSIPVMYFREDLTRNELVNNKYEILRNMRQYVMLGIMRGFNNGSFLPSIIDQIIPDIEFIKKHDSILDKLIDKYIQL